jgi:hypothetical protein
LFSFVSRGVLRIVLQDVFSTNLPVDALHLARTGKAIVINEEDIPGHIKASIVMVPGFCVGKRARSRSCCFGEACFGVLSFSKAFPLPLAAKFVALLGAVVEAIAWDTSVLGGVLIDSSRSSFFHVQGNHRGFGVRGARGQAENHKGKEANEGGAR